MSRKNINPQPPRFAVWLLESFCSYDFLSTAMWDLQELFDRNVESKGVSKAKLLYLMETLSIISHLFFKGKSQYSINKTAMLKHNLLISFRSFKRFKSTFLINLIGLASGLACTLLIYLWVNDEMSIDQFHEKGDRIYQIVQHNIWQNDVETDEYTPRRLAATLMEEIPGIEMGIAVNEDWAETPGIVGFGETRLKATDHQIDKDFFKIFSYSLIQGNIDDPIPNTKSVLISDQLALKLFKNQVDIVGQTIEWKQEEMSGEYIVSGVFESPGRKSSRQFDILFSMELLVERHNDYSHWGSNNERTYLLMEKDTDMESFNKQIEDFLITKADWNKNKLTAQRFDKRYLYGPYVNTQQSGGRIVYVRLFSLVAIFILVIACINFMNLTTAKAGNRMKEIGVKKAIGAQRRNLISQYFSESILLVSIALIVALFITYAFLPQFNQITGKELSLNFSPKIVIGALGITLFTGLISGSYPALYLSGLHPILMLKGKLKQTFGDVWLRKGLVIFQFAISAILITAVMVISKQIDFIQSKNLGFDKSNLLRFDYVTEDGPGYRAFLEELKSIPQLDQVSGAIDDATGEHGGTSSVIWPGKPTDQRTYFEIISVGFDFIETMGIEMAEGRSYDVTRDQPGRSKMIFNEAAIEAMGIEDPIGKIVQVQNERSEIIGVVKNFHFQSMYESIHPLYMQLTDELEYTLIRTKAGITFETLDAIEEVYSKHLAGVPFDFTFVDDDYQSMYQSELSISKLSQYFAGIAIIISCLGLLGLTAFTAERRSKEIGIRKVLGSGNWRIIYLLSSDFSKMVIMALLIGLPASYFIAESWIQNFAFSIDLQWSQFLLVGVITLLIAWVAVGIQTLKASQANPIEALRSE